MPESKQLMTSYEIGDASTPAIENKNVFRLYGRTLDVARTAVHYFMFTTLGLMLSIPGPTLIDLQQSSGTDSYGISFIFSARSVGYLIGSISGGIVLDIMKDKERAIVISSVFVALGAFVIPWCRTLTILLATFMVTGFAMGFCNTGSNACCLRIWGSKGAPIIQGLHFFYGVGGFLAPVLAAPFLSKHVPIATDMLGLNSNMTMEMQHTSLPVNASDIELRMPTANHLTIPTITFAYTIIGSFATFVSLCFLFIYMLASKEKTVAVDNTVIQIKDRGLLFTSIVVILASMQTGLISGVEVSFAQMLTSYVVNSTHKLSKVTGSYLTSVYWGAFTLTRGMSIFLALKVTVMKMLIFDLTLAISAAILLLIVGSWSVTALWIGTALLGIGVASVFPATLSWVENYININNRIASVFTVVSNILEMTVPMLISMYLKSQPNALFQFMTTATILCSVIFIILCTIFQRKGDKYMYDKPSMDSKETNV